MVHVFWFGLKMASGSWLLVWAECIWLMVYGFRFGGEPGSESRGPRAGS